MSRGPAPVALRPAPDRRACSSAPASSAVAWGAPTREVHVQFDELRYVCQEAALDLVRERPRPLPPTVVLPGAARTRLVTLPRFPDEDEARHAVLAQLAQDEVTAASVPAWGFVAEAEIGGQDAVVVVYGARRHAPHLTAAWFAGDGDLAEFAPDEELDPTAMPFLHPLQHAVDALPALDQGLEAIDPKRAGGPGSLPIV
ncbi:hypothetical protein FTX61_09990 [Nitriliruptoraceae bacterium ZYF776]|nr:hypothetical protein [Profundirhabdus halotolerans]